MACAVRRLFFLPAWVVSSQVIPATAQLIVARPVVAAQAPASLSGEIAHSLGDALAAYFLSVGLDSLLTRWPIDAQAGASVKWDLYWYGFGSWVSQCCTAKAASLAYAVTYTALWGLVVTLMYRRRLFIGI